jgi:hypothetical protein
MRWNNRLLVVLLAFAASNAQAALKDHDVKYRLAIMDDDRMIHETRHQSFNFRMEIVDDTQGVMSETIKNGHPFVAATKGERYSVRLYNPLPVRVAVNLTVDGLNSISGQPSGIADGQKWMIDPYSSITIPGWQVSGGEARRFFFTEKPKSYAKWRGDETGKDLAANCGVIGAAYFWSQEELNQYYESNPVYRTSQRPVPYTEYRRKAYKSLPEGGCDYNTSAASAPEALPPAPACASAEQNMDMKKEEAPQRAGTGMGESESNPTYQVSFNYDTGMYSLSQALVIYYDFDRTPSPYPFPALSYAPEMH